MQIFATLQQAILAAFAPARPDSIAAIETAMYALVERARLLSDRNNERANELENQRAALQAEIERLDAETDEADLLVVGLHRTLAHEPGAVG